MIVALSEFFYFKYFHGSDSIFSLELIPSLFYCEFSGFVSNVKCVHRFLFKARNLLAFLMVHVQCSVIKYVPQRKIAVNLISLINWHCSIKFYRGEIEWSDCHLNDCKAFRAHSLFFLLFVMCFDVIVLSFPFFRSHSIIRSDDFQEE